MWEESRVKNVHRIINSSSAEGIKYKNTVHLAPDWGNKSHNLSFNSSRVVWQRSEQLCCHLVGGHVQARCQAVMFEGEEKSAVQRIVSASSGDFKLRPNRS